MIPILPSTPASSSTFLSVPALLELQCRSPKVVGGEEEDGTAEETGVYSIASFLKRHVPSLDALETLLTEQLGLSWNDGGTNNSNSRENDDEEELRLLLRHTLIIIVPTTVQVRHSNNNKPNNTTDRTTAGKSLHFRLPPTRSQSQCSLVQDCIWTLLQQSAPRSNNRRRLNLLCRGYSLYGATSTNALHANTSRSNSSNINHHHISLPTSSGCDVVQRQLNAGTDYCRRSRLFAVLHQVLGDDILRWMLLQTCLFLPILSRTPTEIQDRRTTLSNATTTATTISFDPVRGNYWQVVGPPIVLASPSSNKDASSSNRARATKTKRSHSAFPAPHTKKKLRLNNVGPSSASNRDAGSSREEQASTIDSMRPDTLKVPTAKLLETQQCDRIGNDTNDVISDESTCKNRISLLSPRELPQLPPTQSSRRHRRKRPFATSVLPMSSCPQYNVVQHHVGTESLEPHSCINRKPLFYSNSFSKTVGHGLWSRRSTKLSAKTTINKSPVARLWDDMSAEFYQRKTRHAQNATTTTLTNSTPETITSPSASVEQMCSDILRRHARTDYPRLLQRYCPLPSEYTEMSLGELARHGYSSTESVAVFIQSCVHSVFPQSFWYTTEGSNDILSIPRAPKRRKRKKGSVTHTGFANASQKITNEAVFLYQTLPTFVSLRRHDDMTNNMVMQNVRVTRMAWLYSNTNSAKKKSSRRGSETHKFLVLSILRWLLHEYVIPLLHQVFYVTECEFHSKRIMYYRKPVWALFRMLSMKKILGHDSSKPSGVLVNNQNKMPQYTEMKDLDVAAKLRMQPLGLSRLRLVPKTTGVRPIATLSKREAMLISVNNRRVDILKPTRIRTPRTDDTVDDEYFVNADFSHGRIYMTELAHRCAPKLRIKAPELSRLPTNILLGDVFAVLSFEYKRNQRSFGSGLMGLHHFYPRYHQFLLQWKNVAHVDSPIPGKQLYFGSVDIRHCYDNINQDHLLAIVDKLLSNDDYAIQKYSVTHSMTGSSRVRRVQMNDVCLPEQFVSFADKMGLMSKDRHSSVFVDGVNFVSISKLQIMDLLRLHLQSNMVVTRGRFENRYLLQTTGIPQGSILSTLLCNFYYGEVERRLLCHREVSNETMESATLSQDFPVEILARMVDDFLLVTTEPDDLKKFFKVMHRGDSRWGVEINSDKTSSSVAMTIPMWSEDNGTEANLEIADSSKQGFFSWCGMLFDTRSGEVRIDYSRFVDGKGGDGSAVEQVSQKAGQLAGQMQRFVRPRCIPILFDSFINSYSVQVINFYQMMAYAAVKTVEQLLSCGTKLASSSPILSNPSFLVSCIDATIEYSNMLIQCHRTKTVVTPISTNERVHRRTLALSACVWLGWCAFCDVFGMVDLNDFQRVVQADFRRQLLLHRAGSFRHLDDTVRIARETMNLAALLAMTTGTKQTQK